MHVSIRPGNTMRGTGERTSVTQSRPAVLIIEPGLGGGVSKHVRDLIELLNDSVDFFLLAPNRGGLLRLSKPAPDPLPVLYFRAPHEFDALLDFLRAAAIERVH